MLKNWFTLASIAFSTVVYAADSYYCPQNHAYINVGMKKQDVLAACGTPTAVNAGANTVSQQVPVVQLVYSNLNPGPVEYYQGLGLTYQQWNIPSGSQGINLQVNLINNKVSSITLNQEATNGVSACANGSFQIGDDITAVMNACGSPDIVNNSYINQSVPKDKKPETWTYTNDPYQPPVTLTFVEDVLQSIQ